MAMAITSTEATRTRNSQVNIAARRPSSTMSARSASRGERWTKRPVMMELATFQCLLANKESLDSGASRHDRSDYWPMTALEPTTANLPVQRLVTSLACPSRRIRFCSRSK